MRNLIHCRVVRDCVFSYRLPRIGRGKDEDENENENDDEETARHLSSTTQNGRRSRVATHWYVNLVYTAAFVTRFLTAPRSSPIIQQSSVKFLPLPTPLPRSQDFKLQVSCCCLLVLAGRQGTSHRNEELKHLVRLRQALPRVPLGDAPRLEFLVSNESNPEKVAVTGCIQNVVTVS